MSDESNNEITEEAPLEDVTPLEVIVKKEKKELTPYDSKDDDSMDDIQASPEQIKEFEDGSIT